MSLAFIGLLSYVFLEYLRPEVLFPGLAQVPVLRGVAILTGIAFVMEQISSQRGFTKVVQNRLLVALLFWLFLTNIFSGGRMFWYAKQSFLDFGKIVFVYFLVVNIVDRRQRIRNVIKLVILLTFYLSIGGIFQSVCHLEFPGFEMELLNNGKNIVSEIGSENQLGRIRYSGIFSDSNDFAQILLIGLALVINYPLDEKKRAKKGVIIFVSAVTTGCILLTGSRGGLLGLSTVFLFWSRRRFGIAKSGLCISVLTVCLLASGLFMTERLTNFSAKEASAHGRIEAWTNGWYMLMQNPVFGVGHNFFEEHAHITAHNSMVLIGAEAGFVGLYLWLGVIYFTFKQMAFLKHYVAEQGIVLKSDEKTLDGISDALKGFLVTAFFLSRTYIFVMYFLIGLAIAAQKVAGNISSNCTAKDLVSVLALELGGLIVWKGCLILGWS